MTLTFNKKDLGECYPVAICDGHISRMGLVFLKYVNTPETKWGVALVAPYTTNLTQFHDDSRMNGKFKMELGEAKRKRMLMKREAQLEVVLRPNEIVIVAKIARRGLNAN